MYFSTIVEELYLMWVLSNWSYSILPLHDTLEANIVLFSPLNLFWIEVMSNLADCMHIMAKVAHFQIHLFYLQSDTLIYVQFLLLLVLTLILKYICSHNVTFDVWVHLISNAEDQAESFTLGLLVLATLTFAKVIVSYSIFTIPFGSFSQCCTESVFGVYVVDIIYCTGQVIFHESLLVW